MSSAILVLRSSGFWSLPSKEIRKELRLKLPIPMLFVLVSICHDMTYYDLRVSGPVNRGWIFRPCVGAARGLGCVYYMGLLSEGLWGLVFFYCSGVLSSSHCSSADWLWNVMWSCDATRYQHLCYPTTGQTIHLSCSFLNGNAKHITKLLRTTIDSYLHLYLGWHYFGKQVLSILGSAIPAKK